MVGHIETACFHHSGGHEMIFAANREAEWLRSTSDIRECYGKLFDKESGSSVIMLSPAKNGVMLTVSKMIPNRFGDNLTAYLYIPNALNVPGETLQGIVFDVISSLAHNRRDIVCSCLSSISKFEYEQLDQVEFEQRPTNSYAYRKVRNGAGVNSLSFVLNNLFQDYYLQYKYIFLAIDDQHIANPEQYKDLTDYPLKEWRPVQETDLKQALEADCRSNHKADVNNNEPETFIKCSECGYEVSDKALACPKCGCPVQQKQMQQPVSEHQGGPQVPSKSYSPGNNGTKDLLTLGNNQNDATIKRKYSYERQKISSNRRKTAWIWAFTILFVIIIAGVIIYAMNPDIAKLDWGFSQTDKAAISEEIPQERIIYQSYVNVRNCFIVISKKSLSLKVYEGSNMDTTLVAVFPVCLSKNKGQKYTAGDNKTPECSMDNPFRVTQIEDASTWRYDFGDGRGYILAYGHWFIRLNSEFSGIGIMGSTNNERSVPGRESSGSIRLKDDDLDFLKEHYVFEGMKVVIKSEEEGLYDFEKRCTMLMENSDIPKKQNGSPNARDNSYSKGSGIDLRNRDLIFSVGGVSFCLKYVEGGTFIMGATDEQAEYAEKGEFPTHSVTLHDYYLGETEVTQELWEEVMGYNPANTIGASLPIENISWNDCADFIRELNNRTGKTFRLPTEAEWEYAARGGIYSRQCVYSGSDNAEEVGWVKSNCDGSTHPVGTRNSNELGIYDMTGNVCEWCQDWMSNYNSTDQVNPVGPNSGTARVGRGGGWCNSSLKNRVSTRFAGKTTYRDYNLGFRIAM